MITWALKGTFVDVFKDYTQHREHGRRAVKSIIIVVQRYSCSKGGHHTSCERASCLHVHCISHPGIRYGTAVHCFYLLPLEFAFSLLVPVPYRSAEGSTTPLRKNKLIFESVRNSEVRGCERTERLMFHYVSPRYRTHVK